MSWSDADTTPIAPSGHEIEHGIEASRRSLGDQSCIAASQQLFDRIWNMFIPIIKRELMSDGDAVVVSDIDLHETYGTFSSIDTVGRVIGTVRAAHDPASLPTDLRAVRIALMRQLLINASLQACLSRQRCKAVVLDWAEDRSSGNESGPLQFELGLHCQETEFLRARVIKGVRALVQVLEQEFSQHDVAVALDTLWDAVWSNEDVDLIATQLLYADSVYAALPRALSEAAGLLAMKGLDASGLENCLKAYTWLYGDRDGRPHDTDAHTERLIVALERGVRANYQRDLAEIAGDHSAPEFFQRLADRLEPDHAEAFDSPRQLLAALEAGDGHADERVRALMLRINVFGFHYLKIEFRQNAAMLTEVVDSIVPSSLIAKVLRLDAPASYAGLTMADRVRLLTCLLDRGRRGLPEEAWLRFCDKNAAIFHEKSAQYQGRDYIDIYNVDRAHIRVVNAVTTLNTLRMLERYRDRITIHGIAEAGNIDEPLALLFLLAAAGHRNGVDIALQPEDLAGAESMLQQVEQLYGNPVYREHLAIRGDKQFITFGPSDTGKQGGKAMHIANMQIAKQHRAIARRFGIELVPSIVIGYEHARSNGSVAENIEAFDALAGRAVRYMLSGILEMRSHLLTPLMAHQSLRDLFLLNATRKPQGVSGAVRCNVPGEPSQVEWTAVVRLYKQKFFEHPLLPALLRDMARFDIVRANTKSTRPPSRAFDVQDLESRPDAIRAIPWTRAFLLSGVHHELIGASLLAALDAGHLRDLYRRDASFCGYVRNIAYAAARTRMELAWRTLSGSVPELAEVVCLAGGLDQPDGRDPRVLLASIHLEYVQAKRMVYKALHGAEPSRPEELTADQLLRSWPLLAQEVAWKEREIDRYVSLLVATKHEGDRFGRAEIQDIYSGFILSANTDLFFYSPMDPGESPPQPVRDSTDDESNVAAVDFRRPLRGGVMATYAMQ
ncbi:phosphoenolpyruvate carboxylase [Bradyrhizobium oligotrophicum]|uniref:phosphoenolpyruvate carboxylase n=3 Tax=Bradyrhizobium oligotrophicum TaxID=44255 RepID=UPI003EB6FBDC